MSPKQTPTQPKEQPIRDLDARDAEVKGGAIIMPDARPAEPPDTARKAGGDAVDYF